MRTRVSPPWYLEDAEELLAPLGNELNPLLTRLSNTPVLIPVPNTDTEDLLNTEEAKDLTSSEFRCGPAGDANNDAPRPDRNAKACAASRAANAGLWAASMLSTWTLGKTLSANSCGVKRLDVSTEDKTSTKYSLYYSVSNFLDTMWPEGLTRRPSKIQR